MSLSDKIENWINAWGDKESAIPTKKVKEAIRELKKEIFYQIEMAIQSGYINDELFYPYKDLCSDPIDKIFGELK